MLLETFIGRKDHSRQISPAGNPLQPDLWYPGLSLLPEIEWMTSCSSSETPLFFVSLHLEEEMDSSSHLGGGRWQTRGIHLSIFNKAIVLLVIRWWKKSSELALSSYWFGGASCAPNSVIFYENLVFYKAASRWRLLPKHLAICRDPQAWQRAFLLKSWLCPRWSRLYCPPKWCYPIKGPSRPISLSGMIPCHRQAAGYSYPLAHEILLSRWINPRGIGILVSSKRSPAGAAQNPDSFWEQPYLRARGTKNVPKAAQQQGAGALQGMVPRISFVLRAAWLRQEAVSSCWATRGPVSAPPRARGRAAVRCWGALLGAGRGGNASPILLCFLLPSSGRIWELKSPLKLSQKVPWCNLIAQSHTNEALASFFFFCPHRFYLPFGIILPLAVALPQIQPRIFHVEGITYVSLKTHGSLGVSDPCNAELKGRKKKKILKMDIL